MTAVLHNRKVIAALAGLAILFASSLLVLYSVTNTADRTTGSLVASSSLPLRLSIPAIGISATIEYVGVTSEGIMDAPEGPMGVAWYAPGTRPGDVGSAVIDGHSGWKDGTPAVFDTLDKVRPGDAILVTSEKSVTTFVVREVRTFDPTADASSVFTSDDGKAHLNLITCAGGWDPITQSAPERLVVFADKQ